MFVFLLKKRREENRKTGKQKKIPIATKAPDRNGNDHTLTKSFPLRG